MQLKTLGLGSHLKAESRRDGIRISPVFSVIHQDFESIWKYLNAYKGMLENTPDLEGISPSNGLDGSNLLVNKGSLTGVFYDKVNGRPKTIYQSLLELHKTVDTALSSSDVSTEIMSMKDKIGLNKFDTGLESSDGSLDKKLQSLELGLRQISADCFNRGSSLGDEQNTQVYYLANEAKQTQEKSLRDLVDILLEAHGGMNNLGHKDLGQKMVWAVNFPHSEEVAGGTFKFSAPYGQSHNDLAESQRFYNPFSFKVKIKKLYAYVDKNTLSDNTTITLYKNGSPTGMEAFVAGNTVGNVYNDLTEIELEPNGFVQFYTKAGNVSSGSVHVANISIELQEIIE